MGSRLWGVAAYARCAGPLQADVTPAWTGRELLALATDGSLLSFAPGFVAS